MKKSASSIGLMLIMSAGLFGADNALTPQEKAEGWVLLFDGKTLSGWDSVVPQAAGRGRGPGGGAAPGGAPRAGERARTAGRGAGGWLKSAALFHSNGAGPRRGGWFPLGGR